MKRVVAKLTVLVLAAGCRDAVSPDSARPPVAPSDAAPAQVAASTNLYAVVDINGNLVSGNGVTSSSGSFGTYEVTFNRNVSGCAFLASTQNAYSQAVIAYTAGGHQSANGVYVETKNQGGGLTPAPFNLVVICGSTGMSYAVVDYNGGLARSTAGASLSVLGTGRYRITFPTSIAQCAYVATVGDPSNALVFSPSAAYTGSDANPNAVYVETKNPGGGLQPGVPFHLGVVCKGAPGTGYAVVRADGTAARGSPSTGRVSRTGVGQYTVTAATNISGCAKVGVRGSVNTAVPFSPATLEVTPGASLTSFGVQLRDLLFFGGNFSDQEFHIVVTC